MTDSIRAHRSSSDRAGGPTDLSRDASQPVGANPLRGDNGCPCRWCVYDKLFAERIQHVPAEHRPFFEQLKEDWESAEHEGNRLERLLAGQET